MFEVLRGGALVLAVMTTGLMAGAFQLYSHTVMPGLAKTDDKTFVGAFQALDRAIINPLFMLAFLGAFVLTGLATVLSLGSASRPMLPWLIVALVLYLVVLVITFGVNVPLNDALKAATGTDFATIRADFNEARWIRFNHIRSWASTFAFLSLTWSLIQYGKLLA